MCIHVVHHQRNLRLRLATFTSWWAHCLRYANHRAHLSSSHEEKTMVVELFAHLQELTIGDNIHREAVYNVCQHSTQNFCNRLHD